MLLSGIKLYQITIGKIIGGRCRFHPSCSCYAAQALTKYGILKGVTMTIWRILRCNPISKGGVDEP